MKTISIRVVKKTDKQSENLSGLAAVKSAASNKQKISSKVKGWVEELRERKDLERTKSFSLLTEISR